MPGLAGAQPLSSLVDEALHNNREILAAQKKYEAARQRPSQASSLPAPTVSLGYASNGAPYPVDGLGHDVTSNASVMVSQEVPFPGKQKLRGEIAARQADAEFQAYLAVRLNVVSRLKQAYYEAHHAAEGIAATTRYQELLQGILRVSEARYATGHASQQDIFKAQTQFSIFQAQLLRYQQEQRSKQIEIDALLDRPMNSAIEIPLDMDLGDLPATLQQMVAQARTAAPLLAREQKNVESSDLAASLARKNYYPDYTLSGGYFNQGTMPPMWQFRVDLKLPPRRPARRGHRAGIRRRRSPPRLRSRRAWPSKRASAKTTPWRRRRTNWPSSMRSRCFPKRGWRSNRRSPATSRGRSIFSPVFSNLMTVVDNEFMYHDEVMQFHMALARLEEMTGGEIKP